MKERAANLKETKTCTGSGPADGAAADGLEEYYVKMLIHAIWESADGSCRRVRRGESPNFMGILLIRL